MISNTIKIAITVVSIAVFVSCKSSETENKNANTQRGQGERPSVAQLITEMDENKDGKLSESEVKGPLQNDFYKIDTNDDGFLSKEELENAPEPERKGRPQGGAR
ncbi:EF hand domain-containing protein [Jejuia pallidilutea]|uniref:EF hand domain-containing protein n=1 Tax=Jejuia pallidilutea TaxID=504487 RepID=A0A362WZ90_9FLAO|nr:hypothetical protein [Jejuia pallidilutea]PQV47803.1 EF hand domain-containing protein [Jejuia pallidilutea]